MTHPTPTREMPIDWNNVQIGAAFESDDSDAGNPHWIFLYAGKCPLTKQNLFAAKSKLGHPDSPASELDKDQLETLTRSPGNDVDMGGADRLAALEAIDLHGPQQSRRAERIGRSPRKIHSMEGKQMSDWQPAKDAPEDVVFDTKIDDHNGCRNEQRLKRRGNLWFYPDGKMYVYYRPTHYRALIKGE